ncbi:hypothetical protein VR44_20030 [Streptomyces katrae]|uniref:Uncharacterized protein n=1 Tax=Streptomyces katrae TaxID=68223 RepID=A0A0F4JA31_9ACTN|nr:hypothetical protein VR44_20030 [Streptomyces katrae]
MKVPEGVTQPKCGADTERGGRCRNKAILGSGQCAKHQGRWTRRGVAQAEAKEAKAKLRGLSKKKWSWW